MTDLKVVFAVLAVMVLAATYEKVNKILYYLCTAAFFLFYAAIGLLLVIKMVSSFLNIFGVQI